MYGERAVLHKYSASETRRQAECGCRCRQGDGEGRGWVTARLTPVFRTTDFPGMEQCWEGVESGT